MTRLEAIKKIRKGERIEASFRPETHGVSTELFVMMYHMDICDFRRERQYQHATIGPIHCMFWSGGTPHWLHISPKQVLGFIRRNYPRK